MARKFKERKLYIKKKLIEYVKNNKKLQKSN